MSARSRSVGLAALPAVIALACALAAPAARAGQWIQVSCVNPSGSGTILQRGARGTAHLVFTAGDAGGPGVYAATVRIGKRTVYSGTPNTDDGTCVAVGDDGGTLMFDHQQPCPQTTSVAIPIHTARYPDGRHELSVTVSDAAGNVATVLDRRITTFNPQKTPRPRHGIKTRFKISWRWDHGRTLLRSIRLRSLPRHARVTVACRGPHCPTLARHAAIARHARRLMHSLAGVRLRARDRLLLTVSAPHRRSERVQLRIRDGRKPQATLLSRRHRAHHH